MFYDSLVLVPLLISTAWLVVTIRARGFFPTMLPIWMVVWGCYLFYWHLAFSNPPAVGTLFVLLIPTMLVLKHRGFGWRVSMLSCAACVVVAFAVSLLEFRSTYRQHQKMLADYPKVDLRSRLAYEPPATAESPRFDTRQLEKQQESFRDFRYRFGYRGGSGIYRSTRRQRAFEALAQVHAGFLADFIAQPAMGWGRLPAMRLLNHYDLDIDVEAEPHPDQQPPLQDQPAPTVEPEGSPRTTPLDVARNPTADELTVAAATPRSLPDPGTLQVAHRNNVIGFAPPNSFGGVNERLEAFGFQSHAYRRSVESSEESSTQSMESRGWKLARLELVSLLKHTPAAVYVSEHLPAMDELCDAPTRPTTDFELTAVRKLREGQELITEPSPHGLRMVGAIRAIEQCRKCHQVPLGGLLGAFSYQFRLGL